MTLSEVMQAMVLTVGYIERGEVRAMLAASYPLKELHTAQLAFIDKKHAGNIVVLP